MASILLVEDDVLVALNLQSMLESYGHEVLTARNLDSALWNLKDERFDLIITDIFLCPNDSRSPKGGATIIGTVNNLAREQNIFLPIIVMTGGADGMIAPEAVVSSALAMGARWRFIKPIDEMELIDAIEGILNISSGEIGSLVV